MHNVVRIPCIRDRSFFYGVGGGAGGIWKSVIWKLYDPPISDFFRMAPPPSSE